MKKIRSTTDNLTKLRSITQKIWSLSYTDVIGIMIMSAVWMLYDIEMKIDNGYSQIISEYSLKFWQISVFSSPGGRARFFKTICRETKISSENQS